MSFSGGTEKHLDRLWAVGLVAAVLLGIAVLEIAHPYFFFQDENRGQNLPFYVHNLRSLLGGEVPLFNFHQLLGMPHLATVQTAALYPPNYVSLIASQGVFGHPFAAIDIVVAFHLVVAALGAYSLLRFLGLRRASAAFGAFAWTFNGFVVVVSDSWGQVAGAAAALPWTTLFALRLHRNPTLGVTVALAGFRALFFLQGYPQIFIYSAIVEAGVVAATIVFPNRSEDDEDGTGTQGRFLALYAIHFLLAAALTAPVLLPALRQVAESSQRDAAQSWEEFRNSSLSLSDWLVGLVAPRSSLAGGDRTWFWGRSLSYIGHLTLFFALFAWAEWRGLSADRARNVAIFSAFGLIWLLFACDLGVTRIFWSFPVLDRFRWPFKGILLTNYCLVVVAAHGFDCALDRIKYGGPYDNRRTIRGILIATILLLHATDLWQPHIASPQKMFGMPQPGRPPFDEPLKGNLTQGRIVTIGYNTEKVTVRDYREIIGQNYATLFGLHHFEGYDILALKRTAEATFGLTSGGGVGLSSDRLSLDPAKGALPWAYFRVWGVRWYVLTPGVRLTDVGEEIRPVFHDGRRTILRDERAFPMVFWDDPPSVDGLVHVMKGNTVRVGVTDGPGGVLVVNVLHHPNFKATVDGRPVPLRESPFGHVGIEVPRGSHEVRIVYTDPLFDLGLAIAGVALLVVAGCFVAGRRRKAAHPAQTVTVS